MTPPPASVTVEEGPDGARLSTRAPRGPGGHPDVVPGAVGLGATLFGLLTWWLFGLAPAAIFLLSGAVGAGLHLVRNAENPEPVTLVVDSSGLTLRPGPDATHLPWSELVDARVVGIDLVLFGHGHVELARVAWAGPGAAKWITSKVREELEARRPAR